ncbi:Glutamate-gated chloride channel [Hypsibius exemplaris]|uniref:Glutamate-gated chloride channel n=1 Tax=Hypsibius exemplaris TaxID=2072580 RepID=A0A1W0X0H3_HYPEX|nr:Glutamate-gated chloride channel [Hypsibius exemplaris]
MQGDVCPMLLHYRATGGLLLVLLRCLLIAQIILEFGCAHASSGPTKIRGRDGRQGQIFTEKEILDMLLESYDNKLRPKPMINGTAGAAMCRVNLLVRSITKVDDLNMEYSTQLTFREEWNDDRLAYDDGGFHKYLVLPDPDKVWKPDLFFQNERQGHLHNILVPNVFLRIHPNGDIMMSIRLSLTLACPMDLRFFPMDRQVCEIRMASYGYTTDDIEFKWKEMKEPVQLANLSMPRFALEGLKTGYCTSVTSTGSYSCLKVVFFLQREFSYYLVQVYVPTCMLIFVSWVSFWLDPEATPARVSLGVTTLLTMATTQSGINAQLPPVSYTKAIDVWMGVCITFIFAALLEFAFVNYWNQVDKQRQKKQQEQNKRREEAEKKEQEAAARLGSIHLQCTCQLHASLPNHLHLHEGGGTLGSKKQSQTSLDQFGHHRTHTARRSQRSPVYRNSSSGTRLDHEAELLEVDRNASNYAMKPLLGQRTRTHAAQPASFHTACAECNDMGIDIDNLDYQNYEGDLHAEIDETALDDDTHIRMRSMGRNRSSRSKGSIRACPVHEQHITLLSNPSLAAGDLEGGGHRHLMGNHVGSGNGGSGAVQGSRKDLHAAEEDTSMKKRIAQPKLRSCCFGYLRIPSKRAKKIDYFSRLVFPCVFLLFNLLYWNLYLGNQMEWPKSA